MLLEILLLTAVIEIITCVGRFGFKLVLAILNGLYAFITAILVLLFC